MKEKGLAVINVDQVCHLAEILYKSGYFADIKSPAQAVVKVLRGQELGLGPIQSLEQVHVIQGKTALSAGLIAARIKATNGRKDYRIDELNDTICRLSFYENGKKIGEVVFDVKDAEQAGLMSKDMWRKYTEDLLFARALTRGARRYCPEIFGGSVYTPEELQGEAPIEVTVLPNGAESVVEPEPEPALEEKVSVENVEAKAEEMVDNATASKTWAKLLGKWKLTRDAVLQRCEALFGVKVESLTALTKSQLEKLLQDLSPNGDSAEA